MPPFSSHHGKKSGLAEGLFESPILHIRICSWSRTCPMAFGLNGRTAARRLRTDFVWLEARPLAALRGMFPCPGETRPPKQGCIGVPANAMGDARWEIEERGMRDRVPPDLLERHCPACTDTLHSSASL